MGLLTTIIKTFGEPTEKHDYPFAVENFIYSEGTKRLVKKIFLLPNKINEMKVRGSWIIEQTADVKWMVGDGPTVYFNTWKNTKAVEKYDNSPERKYKDYIDKYTNSN